jgi:pimeloyl-ACP methyl ester carboxylesterase
MTLYADTVRLKLEAGNEVEAFVLTRSDGSKRPKCLLLHGNPGSLLDWEQIVPRLAEAADVAVVDLPGFGKSPRGGPGAAFLSLDRHADCAISVATALDWRKPFFLVGHSHGAGVAQVVAARYPERVAGLALVSSLGAPAHGSYRLLSLPGAAVFARVAGRMFRSRLLRGLNRIILEAAMTDIFWPEPVPAETLERELALFASRPEILLSMVQVALGRPCAKLWQSAPQIRCPTLFLHGSKDALVPARCARAIHDRILTAGGRAQFQLVPGAGHMPLQFQAIELVERIVEQLLTTEKRERGARAS